MKIGNVELRNEFIMSTVKTGYSDGSGIVTEKHLNFYKRRANDVGAIIPEPFYLASNLREIPTQMGIDDDDKIEGLQKLTSTIHKGGAKAVAHLNHPGRMANPKIIGNKYISSTEKACINGGAKPIRMSEEDIEDVKNLFKQSALRAEKAGFDLLEIQFGHGYLIAQFLSPAVNDRNDKYGGSFENRARFGLEILEEVKNVSKLPLIIRISGDEMFKGGISLEEMKKFVKMLEEKGADVIHVSAGSVCETPPWYFQHMFVPKGKTWEMARELKKEVNIPIIAVGRINEFADIEKIKEDHMADFIAVGRAKVADPDFVGKYLKKVKGIVRPCLACSDGCLGGVKSGQGLGCLMNPQVGEEEVIQKVSKSKRYAVVGGGLAGMAAAVFLDERGHDVTLYEKDDLGGSFRLAPLPSGKSSLQKAIYYYKEELANRNIKVIYKEAKKEDIEVFDGAIIATGSKPFIPKIKGLKDYNWAEVLQPENMPKNEKVMVIGGGLIGVETAHALVENGNEVILVELLPELGGNMIDIEKAQLLKKLKMNDKVTISVRTSIKEIDGDKVIAEKDGEEIVWEGIDRYVVVTGVRCYNPFANEKLDIDMYVIGDAYKPAKAQDAISAAYKVAISL
ncbi:FAD-dependent oxidoreductase [Petrotoga halophila]|uniref:NADH-ubiquinone oxidoreductase subunit 6 n=1 Tax=Petrotoga halophila DSM 16923 TaxID=1122953 RepID=A0A2S5EH29_9BACT|nr:FAD-dependent oxidoreductase [Petrotoga halophila]POZ92446.1 NADH-ubiquinone oxidoreductase subunit 6 [Petrotoga halophila DSM 16923]